MFNARLTFEPHHLYGTAFEGEKFTTFGYLKETKDTPVFGLEVYLKYHVEDLRNLAHMMAASPVMLPALRKAESFISGFEDDETQVGIPELLAEIRTAITAAEGR